VASCPAIPYGFLFTRSLEYDKIQALRKCADYNQPIILSNDSKTDILWWLAHKGKSQSPMHYEHSIVIETDVSLTDWRANCNSIVAHGFWPIIFQRLHINELELLAAENALMALADSLKNMCILIRCDNTTAIAYLNR